MTHVISRDNRCMLDIQHVRKEGKGPVQGDPFRASVHISSWGNKACKVQKEETATIAGKNKMDYRAGKSGGGEEKRDIYFPFTNPHLHDQKVMQAGRGTFK